LDETASILFVVHNGLTRSRNYSGGVLPPRVYFLSTWRHRTWPNLSDLLPTYLHTANDQRLEAGVAWERGYILTLEQMEWCAHRQKCCAKTNEDMQVPVLWYNC